MYTIESDYKEMVQAAKAQGINTHKMNKLALIEALNKAELAAAATVDKPAGKRGRPVDPNSARQARLSATKTGKRGRPADPNSAWNKRQAELAAKREAGVLHLGRPVDPTSARQARLARKGTVPLGRPKQVKPEAPVVEETTAAE